MPNDGLPSVELVTGYTYTAKQEGSAYSLLFPAGTSAMFSFVAPASWQVSFYVRGPGEATTEPLVATFGPASQSISITEDWQQVTLGPQGPGPLTLTLAANSVVGPDGPDNISVSNLQIGPYPINLELWYANQNEPISAWVDGLAPQNYAVQLSSSGRIEGNSPLADTGDFTIEMWIQPQTSGPILSVGRGTAGTTPLMAWNLYPTGELELGLSGLSSNPGPEATPPVGAPAIAFASNATPLLDGEWHHVAAVRAGGVISLYLDGGQLAGTQSPLWSPPAISLDSSSPLFLGYCNQFTFGSGGTDLAATYLTAAFDEFRIWNYALSQGQIQDGMNHQLTDQESGLLGHWTFDGQNLNDSSPGNNTLTATPAGCISYVLSSVDFEPEGEPYLVTQAQLMQDYVAVTTNGIVTSFQEISGYRVVIAARDGNGNPRQTVFTIFPADPDDQATFVFMDGTTQLVTSSSCCQRATDARGELSFVIDAQDQLTCPVLKVNADFMAPGERVVVSPDRHVHATLSTLTGAQLGGSAPLPSGKKGALANTMASSALLGAAADAIAHVMSAAVDHNLQPERPLERSTLEPEDVALISGALPRYESVPTITAPYDFTSNAISTHYLEADTNITRILAPESMPTAHFLFDCQNCTFTPLTLDQRNQALQGVTAQTMDPLSQLFAGAQSVSTDAHSLLTASVSTDSSQARKIRWDGDSSAATVGDGLFSKVKQAASIIVTTAEAMVEGVAGAAGGVKTLIVTTIDDAGNKFASVLQSVEDAINFVSAILSKLGAAISDIVNFIKELFNWSDIVQTATVIQSVAAQVPAVLGTMLTQIETRIGAGIDAAKNYIDTTLQTQLAQLGEGATFNSLSAGTKQSPPGNIQSNYLNSMYVANAAKTQDTGQLDLDPTVMANLTTQMNLSFSSTATADLQSAGATAASNFVSSPDALLRAALADVLTACHDVLDKAIELFRTALSGLFGLLIGGIDAAFAICQKKIEIPLLTTFFESVVLQHKGTFSLLSLVSVAAAIPFTVAYKLVMRQAGPIFSATEVTTVTASDWLAKMYAVSSINSLLGGATSASAAAVGASAGQTTTTAAEPSAGASGDAPAVSTFQKWCAGASFIYMASSALWGGTCVIEESLLIPSDKAPVPTALLKLKIGFQAVADLSSNPFFYVSANGGWGAFISAMVLAVGDLIELVSNMVATGTGTWGKIGDAVVTGATGVVQLVASIVYGFFAGGTAARMALNFVTNIAAAFEWIPQLVKLIPLDICDRIIARICLVACTYAAYETVTLGTLASAVYTLETGN